MHFGAHETHENLWKQILRLQATLPSPDDFSPGQFSIRNQDEIHWSHPDQRSGSLLWQEQQQKDTDYLQDFFISWLGSRVQS